MAAWALEAKDLPDTPAVALEPLPGSDKPCRGGGSSTAYETSDIITEVKRVIVRIMHSEPSGQHAVILKSSFRLIGIVYSVLRHMNKTSRRFDFCVVD